ncbi:MAG: XdhC family protein, partial [Pseudomonadota bacterium]
HEEEGARRRRCDGRVRIADGPQVEEIVRAFREYIGPIVTAVASAPPGAFFLVMTHNHELDYRLVRAILGRDDSAYCGLIGSKTKRARFERRLRDEAVAHARLDRLICPIGAGGPSSKAPETIAVATAAEILRVAEAGHGR